MNARLEQAKKFFASKDNQQIVPKVPTSKDGMEELKKAYKAASEEVKKKFGGNIVEDTIHELYELAVVNGQDDYRGRLPEDIFVGYFLPYFRERADDESKFTPERLEERKKILSDWIRVAGTAFTEVVIFDQRGNDLFIVPALISTKVVNPVRKDGAISFETIANMAEKLQLLSPTKSVDYQNEHLHNKLKDMVDGKHKFKDTEQRWMDIFARYPLSEDAAKGQPSPKTAPQPQLGPMDDDDLIFD